MSSPKTGFSTLIRFDSGQDYAGSISSSGTSLIGGGGASDRGWNIDMSATQRKVSYNSELPVRASSPTEYEGEERTS